MLIIVEGDLLGQDVEVIVNAWNRNIIPWWLLVPHGVSGAIKRIGGYQPFRELGRHGGIPLGDAVETGAGRLSFKAIIHVAGINIFWCPSEYSIRQSVKNALALAQRRGFASIAFPLIGAGVGGYSPEKVMEFMKEEVANASYGGEVRIVKFAAMGKFGALPPSSHGQLTALALVAVVGSLLFCTMLFYLKWIYPAMMYTFFVAIGFLIGTRGGMHYQGDIDSFLSRHPELSRTELPWPTDYQRLSRKQKFLYSTRGFAQTIANGFLMPVNFFLIGLTAMGVLKEEVAERLFYRHDKTE